MARTLRQLASTVELYATRAVDLRPVWKESNRLLCKESRRHFSAGRLRRTGRLERSLTSPSGADHIFDADPIRMRWGTAVPYASYLINGTRRMRPKLNINLTADQSRKIRTMCAKYIRLGEVVR